MYYQRLKKIKKITKFILPILPIAIIFLFFVTKPGIPSFLSDAVYSITPKAWDLRNSTLSNLFNSFDSLKDKKKLLQENKILSEELEKIKRENFTAKAIEKDNERLQKLLERKNEQQELVPASVINNINFSPYDTFIVDVGEENGITDNMLVITPEGITIGTTANTHKNNSTVILFSAPTMTFDAFINASTSVHEMAKGNGMGTIKMSVPRDTKVEINDTVVLPSFKTRTIGKIVSIDVSPEDAYKTLYIKNPINIYKLRFVLIDTNSIWKAKKEDT